MPHTPQHRPIARVVRVLAVVTAVFTVLVLLVLGGLTTSFGAGMADPVWPTEPWFLVVNGHKYDPVKDRGFLLEHTHRAAGFTTGVLTTALAFVAWLSGPNKRSRLAGLLALIALLVSYGEFHRQMMAATKVAKISPDGPAIDWAKFVFPTTSAVLTAVAAFALAVVSLLHLRTAQPGKWVRAACSFLLIGVMIQGLVGGFRVHLNAWDGLKNTVGVELSQLHGVFAQVVFSLMVLVPVLAAPRTSGDSLGGEGRSGTGIGWLALALPVAVFVQLIWAVWVRHAPTPLMQRLHILTAFVVAGLAVWLAVRARSTPDVRRLFGSGTTHILGILAIQIALGVEAWMGKFNSGTPVTGLTPLVIRTLHQLIGTALLASVVVLAFRVWRRPFDPNSLPADPSRRSGEPTLTREDECETVVA